MNGAFLIPANSKKSLKIFGIFYKFDLILFGVGVAMTLFLIMLFPLADTYMAFLAIAPALITGFLVFPVPNYHNVLTFMMSMWEFFTTRQRFYWKGWCVTREKEEENKK